MDNEIKKTSRIGVYGVAVQDGCILLITQQHGPFADKFDLPGGGIEFGESVAEALRREFLEEVSMTFESMQFLDNLTAVTDVSISKTVSAPMIFYQIGLIYTVTRLKQIHDHISDESLPYAWIKLSALSQQQLSPLAWAVVNILGSSRK